MGKGPAIKENITFFKTFFKILLPFKRKIFYFRQLIEIWTYHVQVCQLVFKKKNPTAIKHEGEEGG